jgi:cell division protein FtsW (lipid II flippase)
LDLVRRFPWTVWFLTLALVALGWLAVARSDELSAGSRTLFERHLRWTLVGFAVMAFLAAVPSYRWLARWSLALLGLSLLLLVAVYFAPPVNGARRWLRLGPIGFQPSELAKLCFVLALAQYLKYRQVSQRLSGLLAPLGLTLIPLLLILKEPDLGTALVFVPVLGGMLLAAGARISHLALAAVCAALLAPVVWSQMSGEQRSRITALAEPIHPSLAPSNDAFHLYQARQMFALGGWWGSAGGPPDSERFVPEAHTDSILSVLAERLGLLGVALVLALYAALVARVLGIAAATREPFGRLLAVGVATLLAVQVLINAGMMVGLAPITGLTLPLVSYGGTSLVVTLAALGLVVNVALRPSYEPAGEPFRLA